MITLEAHRDSDIVLFLNPALTNPFYLFVFRHPAKCAESKDVFAQTNDCGDFQEFTINTSLSAGIYQVDVYEQADYSNLSTDLASYLGTVPIKVYNPEGYCWPMDVLLDEHNYAILDENENFIYT